MTFHASPGSPYEGGNQIVFTDGPVVGGMKALVCTRRRPYHGHLQLTIAETITEIDKVWLAE